MVLASLYQNDIHMRYFLLPLFILTFFSFSHGQKSFSVSNPYTNGSDLIAGTYNYISIIAMQDSPVTVDQLSATFFARSRTTVDGIPLEVIDDEEKGLFGIHPLKTGYVILKVQIGEYIEEKRLRVKPIPAEIRLGVHKPNSNAKIKVSEFKAHPGLMAQVTCCGFDAKCKMLEFEAMRIQPKGGISKSHNSGGKFDAQSKSLIMKAQEGDIFIFRKIYFQCPGAYKQRGEDFIIEII